MFFFAGVVFVLFLHFFFLVALFFMFFFAGVVFVLFLHFFFLVALFFMFFFAGVVFVLFLHFFFILAFSFSQQDAESVRALSDSASESLSPFLSTAAEIRMLLPDKEEVAALFSFVSWKSCFSADPSKRRRSRRNSKRGAEPLTSAWRIGAPQSLLGAASHLGTRPSLAEVAAGSFSMVQNGGDQGDEDAGDRQTGDGHSEEETETEDEEVEDSTGQRRKPASTKLRDLLRAFRDKPGEAAHPAAEETETEEVDEEERQALLQRQGASERGDTADDEAAQAEAPSCLDEAAIEDLWLLQQTNGETRKLLDKCAGKGLHTASSGPPHNKQQHLFNSLSSETQTDKMWMLS
ncbi:putative transmembrane protein [Toxoplasma gondii TgCatPRC2]|uniref:Putative transmembrane protein n=1 Tax=Toxoplasma gondii TgCatPRC2 TaxID=1130821 RepID=A0A151HQM5_TOXGO|nr:putative transmembrane protein [Toxoplasma gondii TgCatPRC2]